MNTWFIMISKDQYLSNMSSLESINCSLSHCILSILLITLVSKSSTLELSVLESIDAKRDILEDEAISSEGLRNQCWA